jgi:hypothetical protein
LREDRSIHSVLSNHHGDFYSVITTLEVLRTAVDAGELDARIEAVSGLVKSGFDKEAQTSKRPTLKLPSKSA